MVKQRQCERCRKSCKHGGTWYYVFCIRGVRYKKAIPEARNKYQAQAAEARARDDVFRGRYGDEQSDVTLKEFVEKVYLSGSKDNKRSWKNDVSRSKPIVAYFKNKMMREITQFNVEQFKKERRNILKKGAKRRAPASVDRELQLLSRIFSLAIERGELRDNPCKGVKLLAMNNQIIRYLTPEQEEKLMLVLRGRRAHLRDILLINLHTGMRRTEILTLHKGQIDFLRDSIELTRTKSGKSRSVPIHSGIKPLLQRLCEQAGASGYLFENPKTGKPIADIKTAWRSALKDAGIPTSLFIVRGGIRSGLGPLTAALR
ncbi:MAG: tyrosine-type recombinase/integrase [Blastocatellia bacterium]